MAKRLPSLLFVIGCSIFLTHSLNAQIFWDEGEKFTKIDSLRGSITPERAWWDLNHYTLNVQVFPEDSSIKGTNVIRFKVIEDYAPMPQKPIIQVELQEPMQITAASWGEKSLLFEQYGPIYLITLPNKLDLNSFQEIALEFEGRPKVAVRAPWDGGFSWKKDNNDKWFIATSNQGEGASLWWPNKDHPYDEADSLQMTVRVPQGYTHVGNGRLRAQKSHADGTESYTWAVTNTINNYGVNINIGDYVHFSELYEGEKGPLDLNYWVLKDHLEKAKEQFKQVPMMMEAFEHWFGPYPFYEDSFKLVEVPYLGMEHQSSVTYGNKYANGYLGRDLSRTSEGLKFDFIIIHEAGHEWFANNITNYDVADMWIHEGFTSYSESLYLEYHFGKESAFTYTRGLRSNISSQSPVIGPYNVRREGSGDMYYKGHNLLHTIRQLAESDSTWRAILRGLNSEFYHQTVKSKQVEDYLSKQLNYDLSKVFDQYLRDIRIPLFSYRIFEDGTLEYQWTNTVNGFHMPMEIYINGQLTRLNVTNRTQRLVLKEAIQKLELHPDYYVGSLNLSSN